MIGWSTGQLLFTDKKNPGIQYTAPACGTVSAINRGAKRVFQSLVIEVEDGEAKQFASHTASQLQDLDRSQVVEQLIESGEWTAIRTRPFNKIPAPETLTRGALHHGDRYAASVRGPPRSLFRSSPRPFSAGLEVLATLTTGKVFVCQAAGAEVTDSRQ